MLPQMGQKTKQETLRQNVLAERMDTPWLVKGALKGQTSSVSRAKSNVTIAKSCLLVKRHSEPC